MTAFNGSTLTWTAGRQLSTLTTADGELYSFVYNENGYLSGIEKSVDGVVEYTEYYTWNGEKLINYRKVSGDVVDRSHILYDDQGEAYGLIRNNVTVYLFNRNLQGDITEIIEPDVGFAGAEYYYDAYGNYTVRDPEGSLYSGDTHAKYVDDAVPFTYRGYLDINIGDQHLYYLGSRFYSPQLGRFISADIHVDTGTGVIGTNMYAYCNNNPVMNTDPTGESSAVTLVKILGIGALPVGAGMLYLSAYNNMLCVRLFQWSFTHRHKNYLYDFSSNRLNTKNWSSFIANKLKKSQVIIAEVKEIISKMGSSKTYKEYYYGSDDPAKISFYWKHDPSNWKLSVDDDLQWSIGNLSETSTFSIYVVKQYRIAGKTRYKVYCTLQNELWDFDKSSNYNGLTDYLVGIGCFLEDSISGCVFNTMRKYSKKQ